MANSPLWAFAYLLQAPVGVISNQTAFSWKETDELGTEYRDESASVRACLKKPVATIAACLANASYPPKNQPPPPIGITKRQLALRNVSYLLHRQEVYPLYFGLSLTPSSIKALYDSLACDPSKRQTSFLKAELSGTQLAVSTSSQPIPGACSLVLTFVTQYPVDFTVRQARALFTLYEPATPSESGESFDEFIPLEFQGSSSNVVCCVAVGPDGPLVMALRPADLRELRRNPDDFFRPSKLRTRVVDDYTVSPPRKLTEYAFGSTLRYMDLGTVANEAEFRQRALAALRSGK
ncbi:hypothetical protein [Sphingomonas sp. R1]|uniref:hypothetical protein n=1 Tax=Sphingomonas sp. R1 TaxID=399176 RepID=UPI0022250036|nr:hypothetical protein [Sphingomonas sp. R1]UYY76829.1 hypothetical protein OIM94_15160 [Sphingomonas sp. R1]